MRYIRYRVSDKESCDLIDKFLRESGLTRLPSNRGRRLFWRGLNFIIVIDNHFNFFIEPNVSKFVNYKSWASINDL